MSVGYKTVTCTKFYNNMFNMRARITKGNATPTYLTVLGPNKEMFHGI